MLDVEFYQLSYGVNFFLKISKHILRAHFIIYQKCPFKGQLSLAGHAQSSVPWELSFTLSLSSDLKIQFAVGNAVKHAAHLR